MKTETTEFKWPPRQAIVTAKTFDDVWGVRNPIKGMSIKERLAEVDKYTPKTTETEENAITKRKFKTKHVSGFTRRLKKTAAEFGDNLTEGEIYHLKHRQIRHLRAWHTHAWELEDQTTDCEFIRSLRVHRRLKEKNISKEERLEVNKLVYRRVEQLATVDPKEKADLWGRIEAAGPAADCFTLRKNGSRRSKAEIINTIKHNLLKARR